LSSGLSTTLHSEQRISFTLRIAGIGKTLPPINADKPLINADSFAGFQLSFIGGD
jgi:hypothetical protein